MTTGQAVKDSTQNWTNTTSFSYFVLFDLFFSVCSPLSPPGDMVKKKQNQTTSEVDILRGSNMKIFLAGGVVGRGGTGEVQFVEWCSKVDEFFRVGGKW